MSQHLWRNGVLFWLKKYRESVTTKYNIFPGWGLGSNDYYQYFLRGMMVNIVYFNEISLHIVRVIRIESPLPPKFPVVESVCSFQVLELIVFAECYCQYFSLMAPEFCMYWGRILGCNWGKSLKSFLPCYSQSLLLTHFTPLPHLMSKSGWELVCYVNIV